MRTVGTVAWGLAVVTLLATCGVAVAEDPGLRVAETGVRVAGGINPGTQIQYYALHGDVGFRFWRDADRWLADHDVSARWLIEPWVAFVSDEHGIHKTNSFEIGVLPIFGRLTFGDWRLRPFVEGGEGILYTDMRKEHFGTRVQFASQFGAGLEYEIRPDLAFTIAGRLRHMSNASITSNNHGLNTYMGLIGFTFR